MVAHMSINPALRQGQSDYYNSEASLVYISSPRLAKVTQRDPMSTNKYIKVTPLGNTHNRKYLKALVSAH